MHLRIVYAAFIFPGLYVVCFCKNASSFGRLRPPRSSDFDRPRYRVCIKHCRPFSANCKLRIPWHTLSLETRRSVCLSLSVSAAEARRAPVTKCDNFHGTSGALSFWPDVTALSTRCQSPGSTAAPLQPSRRSTIFHLQIQRYDSTMVCRFRLVVKTFA